jgi:Cu2+-exporting ATPase
MGGRPVTTQDLSAERQAQRAPESHARAVVLALTLRDRHAAQSAPRLREPTVTVVHALPGRLRFRLDEASVRFAPALAAYLHGQSGVVHSTGDCDSGSVLVRFDPAVTSAEAIVAIACTSARSSWPEVRKDDEQASPWRLVVANTAVLAAALTQALEPSFLLFAVAATALPSARRAARALAERRLTVDVLDLAAIVTSLATGRFATASFMTWLLGVGDLLLDHTGDRARAAIGSLMRLDVADAWRLEDGQPQRVSVGVLAIGDRIVVYPGERVAADGVVVQGEASVDEKALTGESVLRARVPGDRVLAATVVVDGRIVVDVDRVGTDTAAARIVSILQGAGSKPMVLQREVEAAAIPRPIVGATRRFAAAVLTGQVDRLTSILITDFGTGVRIAAPTAALSAMTLAARRSVLVKGAQYLERLARTDTVIFDKTGTLTLGSPAVIDVTPLGDLAAPEALALAAAAEVHQHHPVAVAVRRYAAHLGVLRACRVEDERYAVGTGLSATVDGRAVLLGRRTFLDRHGVDVARSAEARSRHRELGASSLFVAVDGDLVAAIAYADTPRPESLEVIEALRARGRRQVLLMSGDSRRTVEAMGKRLGVDRVLAELLPEDKAEQVKALKRRGHVVAMVGDGINDAPALALADVGISLRGGTDVALETADIVLLEGGLQRLPCTFAIADEAMRSVRHGLFAVLAPNAVAIVLGALGLLPPAVAAAINNGSTIVAALIGVAPLIGASKQR